MYKIYFYEDSRGGKPVRDLIKELGITPIQRQDIICGIAG